MTRAQANGACVPWFARVPLQSNELFSTWLARAALAQGCDPLVLTADLWPGWRAWIRDLDRGLSKDRLDRVAVRSGLSTDDLERATLRPASKAIDPDHDQAAHAAHWPWILAQGARNRSRLGGIPYCPACLNQDAAPYFRRQWRLAWHIGCSRHGGLLLDRCPHCSHPTEPHRCVAEDRLIVFCPRCHHDLRSGSTVPALAEALAFQHLADAALNADASAWGPGHIGRQDWFRASRRLVSQRLDSMTRTTGTDAGLQLTRLKFELLSPNDRQLRLVHAWRAMQAPPDNPALSRARLPATPRAMEMPASPLSSPNPAPKRQTGQPRAKHLVQRDWARLLRRLQQHPAP